MPSTLTKKGIETDSLYLYRETVWDMDADPPKSREVIRVNTGYTVTTNEGEAIRRDLNGRELTGGEKTRAINMFADNEAAISAQEGI